jgi:ABC-type glycerol-3-phosphate transport system substrate-binding protein
MKKLLVLLAALLMAIGLAACSSKENSEVKAEKSSVPKTDVKKEMVKFYTELGKVINANDIDLNSYEADVEKAAQDPKIKIEPEEKIKASESAAAVVTALKDVQVPASLKDQKTDLEAALKDYIASYQMKADELKKDTPSLDKANASFKQGEEKLGKAHESINLLPSSLSGQVN